MENEKYMIQAMNEMCENVNTFMFDCWDNVEEVGKDFHAEAKNQTLDEAIKELDYTCSYFRQCCLAKEKIEPTDIMDMVIAAAVAFKKLEE